MKILSTSQSTGIPTVIKMRPGLFVALVKQIQLEENEPGTETVSIHILLCICMFFLC